MKFEKISKKRLLEYNQMNKIFNIPIVKASLEAGGFISGGFARNVFLRRNTPFNYLLNTGGDIDIFFDDKEKIKHIKESFYTSKSHTGICYNSHHKVSNKNFNKAKYIKVQLVDIYHGKPKDVFQTFDFKNVNIAINKDGMIYDKDIEDLENRKTLMISNSRSPLLLPRVFKYLTKRSLFNMTSCSEKYISEWLARFSIEKYEEHPLSRFTSRSNLEHFILSSIKDRRIIKDIDLSLLFGKVILHKSKSGTYGNSTVYIEEDIAIKEATRRSQNELIKS